MARKAGLGRGLDALFADAAPIYSEEMDAVSEISGLASDAPEASGRPGAAGAKRSSSAKGAAQKTSAKKGSSSKPSAGNAAALSDDSGTGAGAGDRILYIDINDIRPNSAQPRIRFDEDRLNELAESISSNGVIQPLIIRESSSGYELVAGERRWRAARIAGLRRVPCLVRDYDDTQNAIVAIIENMQREDLDPIEEAIGLRSMTEKYGFTQEQVSASLGRSRTYIANSIRLLKLPDEIQRYISEGQMSAAHGRTIINIPDKARQKEIAEKIIRNDLSVRATERLAERVKDELRPERKKRKPADSAAKAKPAEIKAAERELMEAVGTRVTITGDEKAGRIELEYYSLDELNRLIDGLKDAFRQRY